MKLAHTMIRVKDLDATLDFYTDFIGLTEVRRKEIGDEATLIFLTDAAESYTIELTVNHGKTEYTLGDQFGHLAFYADDLEKVIESVERRGFKSDALAAGGEGRGCGRRTIDRQPGRRFLRRAPRLGPPDARRPRLPPGNPTGSCPRTRAGRS